MHVQCYVHGISFKKNSKLEMGHDITAYYNERHLIANKKSIAYFGCSAFYPANDEIYKALNCFEFYGGVSGTGDHKQFNKKELIQASIYLQSRKEHDLNKELKFINKCLENLDPDTETVLITFC